MILVFLFVSALIAFAISTVAGGGAGLMLLPLLALFLPGAQVPVALSIGTSVSSISRISVFWRSIRWDVVRWFLPAALPGAALGVWLLSCFEPVYVKLILGLFLVANLPLLFLRSGGQEQHTAPPPLPRTLMIVGASVGLLSGFTGAVGVAFNRFYFRLGLGKSEIVATRAMNEAPLHVLKIMLYAAFGLLTGRSMIAGGVVAIAAVCASWIMQFIIPHVGDHLFRRAGVMAMVAAGISMVGTAAPAALARNDAGIRMVAYPEEQEVQAYWGAHAYMLGWNYRSGLSVEKRLTLDGMKPRYRRLMPPTPAGAKIVAIEKFEQIDREGLEVHYLTRSGKPFMTIITASD
ncbi:MAG TPA: sulfite exporter TauE/SafE family protein [Sphingobium sp.]|uniref:sulfite exporter TauE/SafE family protein n=1 Tax=Sphingobium sp. TaxID=1912891 RepID=UPI002ED2C1B6